MTIASRLFEYPTLFGNICLRIIRRFKIGSYEFRLSIGAVDRPHYAYLVYHASRLAAQLGHPRVSILEFGVAGGAGLLALERHADNMEKLFLVKIEIYGFDTGKGLPKPLDFRDLPYHWKQGFYEMDVPVLKARLKRAKLVLGDVNDTVAGFFKGYNPAPIGAISQDLDFYSSTVAALKLLDAPQTHFLPRVFCYFDDTIGGETELYGDFTGQRLAIHEFNDSHSRAKLTPIYYMRARPAAPAWHHKMWSLHFFEHADYDKFVGEENQQHPI